jgi:hypothetical protein
MSADSNALLEDAIRALPLTINKQRFRIFLFGPGLKDGEVIAEPAPDEPATVHARFLRYFVATELRAKGWIVDFGESPEILEAWHNIRGPIDPGKMEYDHAFTACGAIVILPSSPGSFCEMGLFATSKEISKKTLAVVHAEYQKAPSFFRNGLVRIFQQREGRCIYESYRDKTAIVGWIEEFIEDRYKSYQWDDHDITIGERRKRERSNGAI